MCSRFLIPDNLKTGVISNTRYDVKLNQSYRELAEHYGTAIVPARVRHPQDKSLAEGTVKLASTWIIAALRNQKFFTIAEVKNAVTEKLDELNDRPFQKLEGTRKTAYFNEEKDFMIPLPAVPYEPSVWTQANMTKNETLHIRVNENVKSNAEDTLSRLGISISEAVNMFLCQVDLTGGLPFEVKLPPPERLIVRNKDELRQKIAEADEDIRSGKTSDAKESIGRLRAKYDL